MRAEFRLEILGRATGTAPHVLYGSPFVFVLLDLLELIALLAKRAQA